MQNKRKNREGSVYWGKTRYIDKDNKPRRRYVIVTDNGENVKVAKLTSMTDEKRKDPRFLAIKQYPTLTKETGVYNQLYSNKRRINQNAPKEKLNLRKGNGVFDDAPVFSLDDHDFHRVSSHVIRRGSKNLKQKKGRH